LAFPLTSICLAFCHGAIARFNDAFSNEEQQLRFRPYLVVPNEHLKHACIVPVCLSVIVDARLIAFKRSWKQNCDLDDVDSLKDPQGARCKREGRQLCLRTSRREVGRTSMQPSLNVSRTSGLWNVWRNHTAPCILLLPIPVNLNLSLFRGIPQSYCRLPRTPDTAQGAISIPSEAYQPKSSVSPVSATPHDDAIPSQATWHGTLPPSQAPSQMTHDYALHGTRWSGISCRRIIA